jgi:ribonucleoside-diphosphate reductase alpha chain
MDRINADNPIRSHGDYLSVAPCGEVGLLPGETCQFGYLNVAAFYRNGKFIREDFVDIVHLMTRALDNCLEISTELYTLEVSSRVMRARRKIGIGICGLADLFVKMNLPYASPEARKIACDIVALMNYESKLASHGLAKERGSFSAMNDTTGCRYNERPGFLESKYGNLDTLWVSGSDWLSLDTTIRDSRLMRHCSTVALPPTGRSSLIISASTGAEPLFNLKDNSGEFTSVVRECFDRNGVSPDSLSDFSDAKLKSVLKTSTEILPMDHLMMVAALQPVVDESISKTINLPVQASVSDVRDIYTQAHAMKLKGVTMYRDGSSLFQPKKL